MGFFFNKFDAGLPEAVKAGYPANNVWFKQSYRQLGNAVCPPLIAVLGGAVLQDTGICRGLEDGGRQAACRLALGAVVPNRRAIVRERWKNSGIVSGTLPL